MAQSNAASAVQNLFRTPELKDKILFTLLCLLVYRIGAAITSPGINPLAIQDFIQNQSNGGGLLGLYNLFTGGQLARATVFAASDSWPSRASTASPIVSEKLERPIKHSCPQNAASDGEGANAP